MREQQYTYTKSSLKYIPLPNFISDDIQSCPISLILNNIPITFAAVYCPPKHKISPNKLTEYFSTLNNNYITGGDLSAKLQQWGCSASNPRGNSLLQSLSITNSTVLAPPNYTYWPNPVAKCQTSWIFLSLRFLEISTSKHLISLILAQTIHQSCSDSTVYHQLKSMLQLYLNFQLTGINSVKSYPKKLA